MMRRLRVAALSAATAAVLAGCGSSGGQAVSYTPAAYGEVVGGVGRCYYVDEAAEAQALLAAGLCPAGWRPAQAPSEWEDEYWAYYDSPQYYDTYVPPARRSTYVSVEQHYYTVNKTVITQDETHAVYRGSNGTTVTGPKTGTVKFGSGSSLTGKPGAATGKPATAAPPVGGSLRGGRTTPAARVSPRRSP